MLRELEFKGVVCVSVLDIRSGSNDRGNWEIGVLRFSDNGVVFEVSCFGDVLSRCKDFNFVLGDLFDLYLGLDSREGSGRHWLSLRLSSFNWKGSGGSDLTEEDVSDYDDVLGSGLADDSKDDLPF